MRAYKKRKIGQNNSIICQGLLSACAVFLRTPVDTFEFVRHVNLEGGATAKETPVPRPSLMQ